MVAIEQHFPESACIINDGLAYRILPFGIKATIWLQLLLFPRDRMVKWIEKKMPGIWGGVMCRKRYIDDKVVEAADGQADTVVNLGAGIRTTFDFLAKAPAGIRNCKINQSYMIFLGN